MAFSIKWYRTEPEFAGILWAKYFNEPDLYVNWNLLDAARSVKETPSS